MPALAPRIRLLDTSRAKCLDRRADPLASSRKLDERGSRASVEAVRIECTRDSFEIADGPTYLVEHAPSRAEMWSGEASGK
jgi:hypothetical protein